MLELVTRGLAVWRLAFMLTSEAGPGRVFQKLRALSGVKYNAEHEAYSWNDYTPLICLWCTSVYVAAVLPLMPKWLITLFAVSGIAVLLDKAVTVTDE